MLVIKSNLSLQIQYYISIQKMNNTISKGNPVIIRQGCLLHFIKK